MDKMGIDFQQSIMLKITNYHTVGISCILDDSGWYYIKSEQVVVKQPLRFWYIYEEYRIPYIAWLIGGIMWT